jgi:hypothetical protein
MICSFIQLDQNQARYYKSIKQTSKTSLTASFPLIDFNTRFMVDPVHRSTPRVVLLEPRPLATSSVPLSTSDPLAALKVSGPSQGTTGSHDIALLLLFLKKSIKIIFYLLRFH